MVSFEEVDGCSEPKTNSGEGISDIWDSKADRHGAAGEGFVCVVADMVRRKESRRLAGLEAMVLGVKFSLYVVESILNFDIGRCEYDDWFTFQTENT